jgi:cobalt-zinc-cadmium resistance protein CzcA
VEDVSGMPVLMIDIDKAATARRGLSLSTVEDAIGIAIGGREAGVVFEGDRRFQIVVRLSDAERNNIEVLENLPIALPEATPGGAATMVPLRASLPAFAFPKAPTKSAGTTASGASS